MSGAKRPEAPRTERMLPGVWRLRLPLPWPGVPHGNVWAVAADGGVVLFDTGMGGKGRLRQFDLALAQAGFGLEDVKLLVCTHSHTDHYGLAAPIVEEAGCELWMHPRVGAHPAARRRSRRRARAADRGRAPKRRPAGGAGALPRVAQRRRRDGGRGDRRARPRSAARSRGRDRPRSLAGARDARPRAVPRCSPPAGAEADDQRRPPPGPDGAVLRPWPQPGPGRRIPRQPRRDRAAGRRPLSARPRPPLPRTGIKIAEARAQVEQLLGKVRASLAEGERQPFEIVAEIVGPDNVNSPASAWALQIVLSCLDHLQILGEAEPVEGTDPQRWRSI